MRQALREAEKNVETGMRVSVGNVETEISSVGVNSDGKFIASADANVPDGKYDVRVGYKQTQIINFLFN